MESKLIDYFTELIINGLPTIYCTKGENTASEYAKYYCYLKERCRLYYSDTYRLLLFLQDEIIERLSTTLNLPDLHYLIEKREKSSNKNLYYTFTLPEGDYFSGDATDILPRRFYTDWMESIFLETPVEFASIDEKECILSLKLKPCVIYTDLSMEGVPEAIHLRSQQFVISNYKDAIDKQFSSSIWFDLDDPISCSVLCSPKGHFTVNIGNFMTYSNDKLINKNLN